MLTKKNSCGFEIPHPLPLNNFSNWPSLTDLDSLQHLQSLVFAQLFSNRLAQVIWYLLYYQIEWTLFLKRYV